MKIAQSFKSLIKSNNSSAAREARFGYLFISPWIIGFLLFQALPLALVLYYSFTKYSVLSAPQWIGFDNYQKIFTNDKLFITSMWNTVYIVAFSVPLRLIVGFFLAQLINQKIKGLTIFRTIYYLPVIIPIAATSVLWEWMFQPRYGIINYFFELLGIPAINWLVSVTWSKPAIIIVTLWRIGEAVILFLAGLQAVPHELYEAADIDGAKPITKLLKITIPLITPTILLQVIMEIIHVFQSFVWSYSMTKGGPLNSSLTYVLYIYRRAFDNFQMGYASALSIILFIVILVLTIAIFRTSNKWVYSEVD